MTVFVTDGDQRPALAITRSLGRRGISVVVGEERGSSLASSSRYCARHVTYPSPYRHPDAFDRFLCDFVARERVDAVMPVTDVSTCAVARHQETLRERCGLGVAPFEAFDVAADKWRLLRQAAHCGIAIPPTVFVENGAALTRALPRVSYPAVIKPTRSRIRTPRGWLSASVTYAGCEADLRRCYEQHEALMHYPSLIQGRVSGRGVGVFVICDRGELRTAFSHVRLREKPPSGGVSVLSESTAVDPLRRAEARRLLASLGWHGVAMLEYKQDRTGRSVLMEVNGRFWGSLQLAVDAGVDFPFLSLQLALGRPLDVPLTYRCGVRSRWWLGDLDHLIARLRHRGDDVPEDAPTRLKTAIEFLRLTGRRQRAEVFRTEDARPALYELRRYLADLVQGLRPARHGRLDPSGLADRPPGDHDLAQNRSPYVRSTR